ncbi:MAG: Fur family transcriptional regulator [Ktedonobacteraceae bacterium]
MEKILNTNAQAVLNTVRAAKNHPTALDIYEAVKPARPRIGLATVYRILHHLAQQGLIKELGRSDEQCRYDGQVTRHDHAVCIACGTLLDLPVEIAVSPTVLQAAAHVVGITLESHELRLYGRCFSCQTHSN